MQNMGGIWVLGNREWRKFTLLTIMTKLEIHAPFLVEFFQNAETVALFT